MENKTMNIGEAIDFMMKGGSITYADTAINNPDIYCKLANIKADEKKFIWFNIDDDCYHNEFHFSYSISNFIEYKPEPKLINWYRPKIFISNPYSNVEISYIFYKSKDDFFNDNPSSKVLNDDWETIEAPENYKDW